MNRPREPVEDHAANQSRKGPRLHPAGGAAVVEPAP